MRTAHYDGTGDEDSDGASAITSLSHLEDMRFGLKALLVDSEQLLSFLATKDFSDIEVGRSFRETNSRLSGKLEKLLMRLSDSCETFGESDDIIPIALRPAIQRLLGVRQYEDVGYGVWRPDAILQLANLANFAATLLGPNAQNSQDLGLLQTMWEQFPSPFTHGLEKLGVESFSYGYTRLLDPTFEVGLEIRTQFAVALLSERRSDQNFDPDAVLQRLFYAENDGNSPRFLGFKSTGLYIEDNFLPEEFERQMSERIQIIQGHLYEHSDGLVDVASLTASFPWHNFLARAMSWVRARTAELSQQIANQGGFDAIQQGLQERANLKRQDPKVYNEKRFEPPMTAEKRPQSPRNELPESRATSSIKPLKQAKPVPKSTVEQALRLKQLQEQINKRPSLADFKGYTGALPGSEIEADPQVEDDFEPPPASALEQLLLDKSINKEIVARVCTTVDKNNRQSNKENIDSRTQRKAFIDSQVGATKISFDDGSQGVGPNPRAQRSISTNKRRRHDEDDDGSFEATDTGAADRRRKELRHKTGSPPAKRRSPSKRPRSEIPESVHSVMGRNGQKGHESTEQAVLDEQLTNALANSSPLPSSQRLPPSTQPMRPSARSSHESFIPSSFPAPELPSTAQQLEYLRKRARETVMRVKPKVIQSRRKYSLAEEDRLIELIEEYGISYSLLKQMDDAHENGPLLQERTQVQIKDKAQAMKFQLLK